MFRNMFADISSFLVACKFQSLIKFVENSNMSNGTLVSKLAHDSNEKKGAPAIKMTLGSSAQYDT